jgi:Sec-independent protein secretion pathway component TatC
MIALVPIAFRMPAVLVLVPPAMLLTPATLSHCVQFATLVIGLPAVSSVALDGLVEFMLGVSYSPLAAVNVFCVNAWCRGEQQGCGQDGA